MLPEQNGGSTGKWVTFNDLVDDAMEGGKLEPIQCRQRPDPERARRASSSGTIPISATSVGGRSMLHQVPPKRSESVAYMSTSLSSDDSNSSFNGSMGSHTPSPPLPAALPKPPESLAQRRKRLLAAHQTTASLIEKVDPPTEAPRQPGFFSQSFNGFDAGKTISNDNDKYSAFTALSKPGQGYTGWSTTVMGTGPFGWSDEVLGVNDQSSNVSVADNNLANENRAPMRRASPEDEPWYKGIRNGGSWDKSPSRRFVRNFP